MALRCYLADRPFDVMREYRTRNTELVRVTEEEIREAICRYGRDVYKRQRQGSITQELTEIIAGASAIS